MERRRIADLQRRLAHTERLASIGQMAAGVAHEVNNPAAYIRANLEAMTRELAAMLPSDDERTRTMREMLSECLEGIDRIVAIVRDLKGFARTESGDVGMLDLNEVVELACNMTKQELLARARLRKELQPLPRINGDRGTLCQLITNLLMNAAQAIGDGAAEQNTITLRTSAEEDRVLLQIEDSGAGIPEAIRDRIFEPFFTTKARDVGTGLGLSLAAEIVRKHRGQISFTTGSGGTTFEVRLPVSNDLAPSRATRAVEEVPRSVRSPRVLVVEDEAKLRRVYSRMLQGHRVVTAENGRVALDLLRLDSGFDVVICDLTMPEVDGPAVYASLRESNPKLAERMIFCSGGVFTPRAREFLATIPNPVIEKPIPWNRLIGLIADLARD
jgi:CheY-like chemotaxis protein/two-component sensor histidine kinase